MSRVSESGRLRIFREDPEYRDEPGPDYFRDTPSPDEDEAELDERTARHGADLKLALELRIRRTVVPVRGMAGYGAWSSHSSEEEEIEGAPDQPSDDDRSLESGDDVPGDLDVDDAPAEASPPPPVPAGPPGPLARALDQLVLPFAPARKDGGS